MKIKKSVLTLAAAVLLTAISGLPASAQEETSSTYQEINPEGQSSTDEIIANNLQYWKGNGSCFSIGYSTGSFDLGSGEGKLTSNAGAAFKYNCNIYVHPKPIANMVKFGVSFGPAINYLKYKNGSSNISDLIGDPENLGESLPDFGTHFLTAGIGIGVSATVMPLIMVDNPYLARIKVRPFFHVVPSYSALLVSDQDDMRVHSGFGCLFAGGFELLWRKLSIGFEWKGGTTSYKDLIGDLAETIGGEEAAEYVGNTGTSNHSTHLFTVSLGVSF